MSDRLVRVEHLEVAGDPAAWRRIGLTVDADGMVPFMFTSIRIRPGSTGTGVRGWAVSGLDRTTTSVDGLPTEVIDPGPLMLGSHPNGAIEIDHVVVLTDSLDRTCAALEQVTGAPLRRIREVGTMRQGFHRVGAGRLIVEVVERPEVDTDTTAFWGLVITVEDLDAAVALIGPDLIGEPSDAVQPGRRIATLRREAGLGVPVALMSPQWSTRAASSR